MYLGIHQNEINLEDISNIRNAGYKPCIQIFVRGPTSFNENNTIDINKIPQDVRIVIHCSYLSAPWNDSPGAIHLIHKEMETATLIGAYGIIIHLNNNTCSSHTERNDTLTNVLTKLDAYKYSGILFLEINAVKSSSQSFETPQKINKLFARIRDLNIKLKVGLCVDTAHLWSCGLSLETAVTTRRWFNKLNITNPIIIHLNDSAAEFGKGKDIHAPLTRGNIWSAYNTKTGDLDPSESGFAEIMRIAKEDNLTVILETSDFESDLLKLAEC